MFAIRLLPFERTFTCAAGEFILTAALRQGLSLRFSCQNGGCGTCKARMVEGDVRERPSVMALTDDERADGWILLCSSSPTADCTIDVTLMDLSEAELSRA